MSNSQLNNLKSGIKVNTKVTLKISSNVVGDSNDENTFLHNLLLTNTQVSRLRKAFANNPSADINLSNTQLHRIGQSGWFWSRILGPLLTARLPLLRNKIKPLAKSVLIPLGLTAAASAADAAIHEKMFGSGTTTLITSNDTMKIIQSLVESGLLIKCVSETIKNEAKHQKGGFLSMLLGMDFRC